MCTAITFQSKNHYFGRNLDLEHTFGECVTITPRNFPLPFRCMSALTTHYALIGMAVIVNGYPLYFDATNECGLSMAGLNFPGNAVYLPKADGKYNITPFEFIPWVLGQCSSVEQAEEKINNMNLVDISFSEEYALTPLHWLIADKNRSITVEPTAAGIRVIQNPVGVLTNNPPFDYHIQNLSNYINLTSDEPANRFAPNLPLLPYSRGMGAMGLPGDLSSVSRFVRAAFTKLNSRCDEAESASISQFFHILGSVAQQRGCVKVEDGFEMTVYSSCCNTDTCVYYYTTYENSQITAICLRNADLECAELTRYPLIKNQQIRIEN